MFYFVAGKKYKKKKVGEKRGEVNFLID